MEKENLRSNSKDREEAKVYNSASSNQLGIFGDGWIYRTILEETKDHSLVKLRPFVDEVLSRMDKDLRVYYSPDEGRPSISPSVLFKMLLLEYLYNLSDVAVSRICVHDFLFRWFIGVDPTDSIPDDSTLVRFRDLGEEGFFEESCGQDIFNELTAIAKKHGYLKGKLRAIDTTHIFSDTPKLGVVVLLKQGVRKVIQRVRRLSEAKASGLEKKYRDICKRKVRESKEKG